MKLSTIILIFLLSFCHFLMQAQSRNQKVPHPRFAAFKGDVYDMRRLEKMGDKFKSLNIQEYYSDTIYSYKKIKSVNLKKIAIPETSTNKGSFLGVRKKTGIAMILNSEMEIDLNACYEFTLSSDDGSILWINNKEIINNDGAHEMRTKKDSVVFDKGKYPVKLWYFQAYPDRYGLTLNARIIGKPKSCPNNTITPELNATKIILQSIYFSTSEFELNAKGKEALLEISKNIAAAKPLTIKVVGHTDITGSREFNNQLSLKRAISVVNELKKLINDNRIEYFSDGKGYLNPVANNNSIEGRKKNRRVEIIYK